jgi:hypothetical protein
VLLGAVQIERGGARAPGKPGAQNGIAGEAADAIGKRGRIAHREQQAVDAVSERAGERADI